MNYHSFEKGQGVIYQGSVKGKRDGLQSVEGKRGDLPGMCGREEGWFTEC